MKKMSYFLVTIISCLFLTFNVSADSKIVVITGDSVRFRSGATVYANNIIREFNYGAELEFIDDTTQSGNGCDSKWYKAKYGSSVGYVCSEFATIKTVKEETINPDDYKDYTAYLKELGFPDSYILSLISLHKNHPNWQFKVFNSDLDFNEMVTFEYDGYSQ